MGISVDMWRARIGSWKKTGSISPVVPVLLRNLLIDHAIIALTLALISTLLLIGCVESNPGPDAFEAKCSLCNTILHSIANYGNHQSVHLKIKNFSFPCHACDQHFVKVTSYFTHCSRFHKASALSDLESAQTSKRASDLFSDILLETDYRCAEATCQLLCRSVKDLKQHTEGHIRNGFVVVCPFQPCQNKFCKVQTFRTHFSRYHRNLVVNYEPEFTHNFDESGAIGFSDDTEDVQFDIDSDADDYDEDDNCSDSANKNQPERDNVYPENSIRDHVGKFYLWLEGVLLLPTTKVQLISEEVAQLLEMSHHQIKVNLTEELKKEGVDEITSERIVQTVLKRDVVYGTHHKGMDVVNVTTNYMRKQFIKDHCALLEPVQIPLGMNDSGKKKFAHYISIKDTLNVMFRDTTIQQQIDTSFEQSNTAGVYEDFVDGSLFTEHPICSLMKSIQIILFQDAFEFYPLSPTSGTYKCVGFYFMLGNIHPSSRSKVDAIQLVFVVKENDLKYFGTENVLQHLKDELDDLSRNGIQYRGETLPVVLMDVCGDNLGQHFIGGYVESFSGQYSCRFCETTKKMIEEKPACTLPFRTPQDYDAVVAQIDSADTFGHKKGIKRASILNQIPFYHVCNPGQPPCIGHDILEGVAKNDFALFLRYFINIKGWITLSTLNRRIENFKCKGRDSADSLVKLDSSLTKIRGHASEVWLFIRMFPFLLADKITETDDPVWQLGLQLKKICEYVFAPRITEEMIVNLQQLTYLYVENRAKLFQKSLQPKHHYMCHYGDLISVFGPLIRLWTLRFESRHVFFKQAAKAANNYKNITKTLANKYVLNFAYKFTGHMFPQSISFRDVDTVSTSMVDVDLKPEVVNILKEDASFNLIVKRVEVYGITYYPGLWVYLKRQDRNLIVGEIILILYNGECLKFIMKNHLAEDSLMGFHQIMTEDGYSSILQKDLEDYYPLPAYEFQGHLCLSFKHASPSMELV